MKIKDGVQMAGLSILMRPVLKEADRIWKKHGHELVITCGLDGTHSAGSYHYYGLALDLRNKYFTDSEKQIVHDELQESLGKTYVVVTERTHVHVQHGYK